MIEYAAPMSSPAKHSLGAVVALLLLLAGCKEGKQQQCNRIREVVTEEMHATAAVGKATAKLAGAYEIEATAHDGSSATVGIVYGSMLDQSRISIANACPD